MPVRGGRRAFEEFAVAREDIGRAERAQRLDIVDLAKLREGVGKCFGTEACADGDLASDGFRRRSSGPAKRVPRTAFPY